MAWIRTVSESQADGLVGKIYEASRKRSGKVFNLLKAQSLNPSVMQAGGRLYVSIMHGESPLSRAQREMLALVVSSANKCRY